MLADYHALVCEGLRALLRIEPSFEIVGEARTAAEAVQLVRETQPDILLLDLVLLNSHGADVLKELQGQSRTSTIVLTMFDDEARVIDALRSGALGYVLKENGASELIDAIRTVASGNQYLSEKIHSKTTSACVNDFVLRTRGKKLTSRELAVMELAALGKTSLEIASILSISRRTAEAHRANLMKKLGLRTQTDLVLFAIRKGILRAL